VSLWALSATDAVAQIKEGTLSSVNLTKACLARIEETDGQIGAWAHLDSEKALAQAEAMDDLRRRGRPLGPLHGIPVGVKDIFDTVDMPTSLGSAAHATRQPSADCAVVEKLREAGAVILGKTVTTPLAFASPSATRNPHNPTYSPGGSSSGSTLDCVGGFARTLEDVALLNDVITGYDAADTSTHLRPKPETLSGYRNEPPVEPNFVYLDVQSFALTDAMQGAMDEICETLGDKVERLAAPRSFDQCLADQHTVHTYEFARNLDDNPAIAPEHTDEIMKDLLAQGRAVTDDAYASARENVAAAEGYFAAFFNDYDAILCPSSLGEAPLISEATTGDAVCQKIFTFAGLPMLTLPLFQGESGMPMGLQLVGGQEEDDRLFRTARWLETALLPTDQA